MSVNEKMTAIADAIRDKTGGTEKLGLDEMAASIPAVYDAGAKSEYDRFWDSFQVNGKRTGYYMAFTNAGWNDSTFYPKYDMNAQSGADSENYMFYRSAVTDLAGRLAECGVTLNTANVQNFKRMFMKSSITHIPEIDMRKSVDCKGMFMYCSSLQTIDKLIFDEAPGKHKSLSFDNCSNLKNITIEGKIDGDWNLQWCESLHFDGLESIINALFDHSATENAFKYTLYLHKTSWQVLENIFPRPDGITWREYIESKGWNT